MAQKAVHDCGFVQLYHPAKKPAYSPDLCGVRYPDDEALKETVKEWLDLDPILGVPTWPEYSEDEAGVAAHQKWSFLVLAFKS